jgi:hypothetical protein
MRVEVRGETCIMRGFIICALAIYYWGDQLKENEMGGACGMYGGRGKCIEDFDGTTEGKRPIGRPRRR